MANLIKKTGCLLAITVLVSLCQRSEYDNVSLRESSKIEDSYDSIRHSYDSLIAKYQAYADSLPVDLHTSYGQMQRMHQQMEISYWRLMDEATGRDIRAKSRKKGETTYHIRGHLTGTWYVQMQKIHTNIAAMHSDLGQHSMAEIHKELAGRYQNMLGILMASNDSSDPPINRNSILENREWDSGGCSSCHGDMFTK